MTARRVRAGVVGVAIVILSTAAAEQAPSGKGLTLSPKLRSALSAEMLGVRAGVSVIAASLGTGKWEVAAQRAERIRDSFILEQKLTADERDALEHSLPAEFLERDADFHADADRLARAARANDYDLAVFYFSRMLNGCADCHMRYATDVLPGFRALRRPAR